MTTSRLRPLTYAAWTATLFFMGCAGASTASRVQEALDDAELGDPRKLTRVQMAPVVVEAETDPLEGLDDADPKQLLDAANQRYANQDFGSAIQIYALLEKKFPDSDRVPPAIFHKGLAYEHLEEFDSATDEFVRFVENFPNAPSHKKAHFRAAFNLARLKRWQDVADTFWAIRHREDLNPMDELEARVGQGVAMFMMDDHATAEKEFLSALRFHREESKLEFMPAEYWVGQARFYLGEINARAFEKVELTPPQSSQEDWVKMMGNDLEEKCELLLRAQNNFIRAIRVGHTGWATAAGFRIGSLYEKLYDALVGLPAPPDLDDDARTIYREEVRDRVSVLVVKAIKVYETSLQMARRVGERNEWVEKTQQQLERMKTLYLASLDG